MEFTRAERKKAKLRLALCGPSGAGKTYSALLIAKGIGGSVAMVDTERGSGELYADNERIGITYDVLQLGPPYSPDRYIDAIKAAVKAGYGVLIIDSGSHAWMGEGGMLDMVDKAAKANRNNSMAGWNAVAPIEKRFLEAITGQPIHIIMTLRTKTDWNMTKDEKTGRITPVKIGLKPEQRQGIEYEFTVVFDLSVDGNVATSSKDRTDLFKGKHFVPDEETGQILLAWLNRGADGAGLNQAPALAAPAAPAGQEAPAGQAPPPPDGSPPDRGEMTSRGWNRVKKMGLEEQMHKYICDQVQRDLPIENPLTGLDDQWLQWAWNVIDKRYGKWQAENREAA